MKQLALLIFSTFFTIFIFGQAPMEINYQGIARNSAGTVLTNQNIDLRLSIHDVSSGGTILYQETRGLKTDRFGMFTIAIGSSGATNVVNAVSNINWAAGGNKYLQVEISPKNDNIFIDMGAAQLLSVPYAFLAKGASPIGTASGDLSGVYPNPSVANNAISTAKILDGAVTSAKIADGSITGAKLSVIAASGDLSGIYPNPTIAANAINTAKILDGAVTSTKIADASITAAKLSAISAGGDLSGIYPNPSVANNAISTAKILDGAVTSAKIANGSITLSKFSIIPASGDLTGNYPNPTIANGAIFTSKLADSAVTTSKIKNGSITLDKLSPDIMIGGSNPIGSAGGELSGTYPNPGIANNAISTAKILDGAVTSAKIADGSITLSKFSLISASGDLSGTFPSPSVAKLKGTAISNTTPVIGEILKFNGTQWSPGKDSIGSISFPYNSSTNSTSNLFSVTNQGIGAGIEGVNSSVNPNAVGVFGKINSSTSGITSAAVKGINNGSGSNGYGIWGAHQGTGSGVYGSSGNGIGVNGFSTGGYGVYANSSTGTGIFATSNDGTPAFFDISNPGSYGDAVFSSNAGGGNGITSVASLGNGVLGIGNDAAGTGLFGINNAGGEGILGFTISDYASAVVGRNDGTYAAVRGFNTSNNGVGVLAIANSNGAANGTALVAEIEGAEIGNTAVFKANNSNVARIDNTGKGFFNGGTQVGGADIAEFFDVKGSRSEYEPGDVLIISQSSDREVERSSSAYSTLVAGVYATKPGVLLTEKNAEQNSLEKMVPMGVIGVLPTKVCLEGGAIMRGDLLVTSSTDGVGMKADPKKVQIGQVLGKALQPYNENGIGKINVLVSIK